MNLEYKTRLKGHNIEIQYMQNKWNNYIFKGVKVKEKNLKIQIKINPKKESKIDEKVDKPPE